MDKLCDDCQFLIIYLLDLSDQLMLFKATTTPNRWRTNLRFTWEQKSIYILDEDHFDIFNENPELLREFLSVISPTLKRLELLYIDPKYLKSWTSYKFPKMTSLVYTRQNSEETGSDVKSILQIISECAENLEDLEVFESNLKEKDLKILCGLPKLRTLTIGFQEDIPLGIPIEMRAKDITKLTINEDFISDIGLINKLTNLRQLTLISNYMIDQIVQESIHLALYSVQRLDIFCINYYDSENFLLNCISRYPSLKILNLSNLRLDKEFFLSIQHCLENALKFRSSPLYLHFAGIEDDMDRNELNSYVKHSILEISLEPLSIDSIDEGYVKFYFDQTHKERSS